MELKRGVVRDDGVFGELGRDLQQGIARASGDAAWLLTRLAGFRTVTVYMSKGPDARLRERLGFREEEQGANLWLVVPNDDGVFHGATEQRGVHCVTRRDRWPKSTWSGWCEWPGPAYREGGEIIGLMNTVDRSDGSVCAAPRIAGVAASKPLTDHVKAVHNCPDAG